eukprot:12428939-Karenia_brevis.AAC.1
MVRSFIDYCDLAKLSYFILFLDLIKAFDRVIRELVLGWPEDVPEDHVAYLQSLGVSQSAAEYLADFIDKRGPLFTQWGIDPLVAQLISDLHQGTWFRYGNLRTAIATAKGGRQGCKFGSTIFNSGYSVALKDLQEALASDGVILRLRFPEGGLFWGPVDESIPADVSVIDATFVDDECIMLASKSAELLDHAVERLLFHVVSIFARLALDINWNKGKTECIVKYRGAGATSRYAQHRRDGKL